MYAPFFGLKRDPFSLAPDPRYLFMSERHREALAHLLYGLNAGGGFVLLTGEIGAGKTTVCRCFLEQIPKRCNVAYIFNPKLTVAELLRSICDEFGIPLPAVASPTVKDLVDPLNEFLLRTHAVGQNNVLIIDEAQNLSADVLEQLRLLTNLETSERKLLQIVLIGQPELRDKLAGPELEQLAQRVVARFHLGALSEAESAQYIAHRMAVAGVGGAGPFDAAALRRIHRISRGVPRRINLLCDRSLLGAYASGTARIDGRIIEQAATEVFGPGGQHADRRGPRYAMWAGAGAAAAAAGAVGWALLGPMPGPFTALALPLPVARDSVVASASAAASASAVAVLAAPAAEPVFDAAALLAALPRSENQAWRELAAQWKLAVTDGDACVAAQRQQVQCFRGKAEPGLIRRLNRPGILTLRDGVDRPVYAVLLGINGRTATLRVGDKAQTVPLVALVGLWRGEFATFWRSPPAYPGLLKMGDTGAAVEWLATQLAVLRKEPPPAAPELFDEPLRARLVAFQIAQELRPDGIAGPTTFMHLNRASGVDEPQLLVSQAAP